MLFSVIIPIYKVEKYLRACVDSILKQSFVDFELILVDDGSPDACPAICDGYANSDQRVRAIHMPNGGASAARNEGLKRSSGEYIIYVDGDDFFANENSLALLAAQTSGKPDIVLYKTAACDESGKKITYPSMRFDFDVDKCSLGEMLAITVRGEEFQSSPWSKSIKRSFLVDNKIDYMNGLLGEDIDWYLNVIRKASTYAVVNEYLYVYRNRQGSATKNAKLKNLTDLLWIVDKWAKILSTKATDVDETLLNYLGKTYTGLLIMYAGLKDGAKAEYKTRTIKLSYLLKYDAYPRTRMIHRFYSVFGFRMTIMVLSLMLRIRKLAS